eukprot:11284874-Alexandrium_andersonii.AAC.1
MSASLVGSEMCIRDRYTLVPEHGVSRSAFTLQRVSGLLASRDPHVWEAVSYTHLTLPTICSV